MIRQLSALLLALFLILVLGCGDNIKNKVPVLTGPGGVITNKPAPVGLGGPSPRPSGDRDPK
jgi:hypothetical protein